LRLTRVHVDGPLAPGQRVALPEAAAAHLQRVLRKSEGDDCVLFNGDGNDYDARITLLGRRELQVEVVGMRPVDNESPLQLTLVQAVARGEKMDWILQKATELGVAGFIAADSERSEVKLDASRAMRRVAHWRSVIASACEQCGRARVPGIDVPRPLADALGNLPSGGARLLLDPNGSLDVEGLQLGAQPDPAVVLAVGPEGGWSARDRTQLEAAGFKGLRLGPRILRTETAGIAAVAALQGRWGDLR